MVSASTAAVSSLTLSVAVQFLAGSPVALEVDLADAGTRKLLRCDPVVAPATLAAASAVDLEVDVEAFVEVIVAAFGVASTAALVAVALVAVTVVLAVLPTALAALPMLRVDRALLLADTVVDLTVIATTIEAAEDTDDAMTTEAVAAIAAAAVATIDPARAATWSRLVPDRATAAVVGIVIEAMTIAEEATTTAEETTLASVRTKAVRATRESGSCVDTNDGMTVGLLVGILSPLVSLLSSSSLPLRHQG